MVIGFELYSTSSSLTVCVESKKLCKLRLRFFT